ncbi:hypothetical protein MIZ01_0588 [Sideroxyarcus emersonii]|uniref:Uncharacterized protein n=1 Tax=Sideroxyarcus emersonii TaxID=2764705 RepID=A0AAN1X921_9PROT|nr:hypothetical protein [Sideroxyarcus emersonii]BCK86822.1 hypothetical protein MIZ01_0588 [Sideroxyarcus emersonii]
MIETLTLITLATLFLIFFRPGKTPPLESRLTIERPGRYQIVLAPKLNLAQPFIEAIAQRVGNPGGAMQNSETQCFAVRDKQVSGNDKDVYLLAISCRNGMLHFHGTQAVSDDPGNYPETIRKFTHDVLAPLPADAVRSPEMDERIVDAVNSVAQRQGIGIDRLAG